MFLTFSLVAICLVGIIICFLVIFANSSLGHGVAGGPVHGLLGPVLPFQRLEVEDMSGGSSGMAALAPF